jgi:hypothetical protein
MAKVRDYHKKNYRNPFFRKSKSGSATRGRGFYYGRGPSRLKALRKLTVLFLLLMAAVGWVYFLFYSPYFEIKKIEISGLERISEAELEEMLRSQITNRKFLIFKQNNIFWFDENFAEKTINSKYALVSLKIDKKLPNILKVKLEEKKPALAWKTGEKFYHADWDGTIIHELSQNEVAAVLDTKEMPLVYDENNQEIEIKNTILTPLLVQFTVNLHNTLSEKTGLTIDGFVVINQPNTIIKAVVRDGWQIYFSSSRDFNLQIDKLSLFLRERKEEDGKIQEYIDLRFEDRIYYK